MEMNEPVVAVFSPSVKSLYSTAVLEMLHRRGVRVGLVVIRRMFTPSRVRQELRRDGFRLVRKAYKKLILRERTSAASGPSIRNAVSEQALGEGDLRRTCRRLDVPFMVVSDLNSDPVVDALRQLEVRCVVSTGGGLLREPLLEATGLGVLNCHMGILPQYRGMDVVEWAALYDDWGGIGLTTHLMDRGVDTGPILQIHPVPIAGTSTFTALRQRLHAEMPDQIVSAACGLLDGTIIPAPQKKSDGRQFFIIEPALHELAEAKLRAAAKSRA
ncbi:MAG: hypothetical protein KC912_15090 [Proteobacteria bacterium]|nr:hypothetical protein [Pseudomonadota bacterium]